MVTPYSPPSLPPSLLLPQACPYFAVRGIKEEAHIVFCPYNYLIDPLIREQVTAKYSGVTAKYSNMTSDVMDRC